MSTLTPDRAAPESDDEALTAQQMQQAEELLFSEPPREGFAKALFRGEFRGDIVFPYPQLPASQRETVDNAVAAVRVFAQLAHRPRGDRPRCRYSPIGDRRPWRARRAGHDRAGRVRRTGFLPAGLLPDHGSHRRPLLLDGRVRQRPSLDRHPGAPALRHARAESALAAPADQRREAGGVRTDRGAGRLRRLERADDGRPPAPTAETYVLNGTKRYITNGAIADVLTVMARTPDPAGGESKITAFLVTPDLPGFEVVEAADAQVRHPRHGDGEAGLPRHAGSGHEHPGTRRQGTEGRRSPCSTSAARPSAQAARAWPSSAWPPPLATPSSDSSSAGRWPISSWSRRSSRSWPPRPTPWRPRLMRPPR